MAKKNDSVKPTRFLNKVGTFVAVDQVSQLVMFTGIFNATTSVAITMSAQDTRGGVGNALLMREYTDRTVEITLTARDWNLDYVAASVGSLIQPMLAEIFDIEEPVQIDAVDSGLARGLAHVAAAALEKVRQIVALEGADEALLGFLERQVGRRQIALGRGGLEREQLGRNFAFWSAE